MVASTNGISGVIAPDGSVVQRAPERETVVLEQAVQLRGATLPAMWLGRWVELGLVAVAVITVLAGLGVGYRRRAPHETPERTYEHA